MRTDQLTESDAALLVRLDTEPDRAMEALVEQYTALVCHVAGKYLAESEDVKECVNDVFTEVYLHRAEFSPEKSSLAAWIGTIARNRAISRYRKQRKELPLPEDRINGASDGPDKMAELEQAMDVERAVSQLSETDQAIIRMKYYGGMSISEIAAALHIPYEAAKKRHTRSIRQLRKLLLTVLILAALLILAACAYFVLRYFGLVPGYGVNTDPEGAIYVLEEPLWAESTSTQLQLEDAWWQDGNLTVLVSVYGLGETSEMPQAVLDGLDDPAPAGISSTVVSETGVHRYRLVFPGKLPPSTEDTLPLTLTVSGAVFSITLTRAEETGLDEAGSYSLTDEGGLLAVPRLEQGELIVSIYPLNSGEFRTDPMLTQGALAGYGGLSRPITVTAPDGSVLEGTLEEYSYSLLDESGYLEWNFGPAQPGEYTLNVPYLLQYAVQGEDISFSLDLSKPEPLSLVLPGGVLELDAPIPIDDPADYGARLTRDLEEHYCWWAMAGRWTGETPERTPVFLSARSADSASTLVNGIAYPNIASASWLNTLRDDKTGGEYTMWNGFLLGAAEGVGAGEMTIPAESICYRWEHPFTIPMTVEPEPEREEFTQVSGDYGLTAVPRREQDQVILALYPQSTDEFVSVSPTIAHSPLENAADLPITLTAQDGSVWEGTFRPSRDGTYSDWLFGELPAGDYTLHVPYLYVTDSRSYHGAVPLPQRAGETLTAGQIPVGNSFLLLGDVTGLERMTEFPYTNLDFTEAIAYPDGSIASTQELPLQAQLGLTFSRQEGERMTLLDVGVQFGVTQEGSHENACQFSYTTDETGTHLSGLLLRYTPDLYAAELTFTHPLFRLNQSFDIPLHIPE